MRFGEAAVRREGEDVTIVDASRMAVEHVIQAAPAAFGDV
jgi:pyruvate/2-oxoglutarate/acetoin dehydrogenase E1 component